jgi:hypothetical protein
VTIALRAVRVFEDAHSFEQTGWQQDQTHKEMFIQKVPWRRQIDELWQQDQEKKQQES